jgi:hypothetical protein
MSPLAPKCLVLAVVLVGSATPVRAQTEIVDAVIAPCVAATANCTPEPSRNEVTRVASPAADHRESVFHVATGAFVVAASADLSVTMYQIGRGVARERGFGAQWQDSPVAFAVSKSAMTAVVAYGLQRMHKTRPKTALILTVAATAVEGWLAVRGSRLDPIHP